MFSIKTIACITLALALSGCGNGNYSSGPDDSEGEAAAGMLLMGATAFTNGWNQARQPMATCWNYGPMTQCQ